MFEEKFQSGISCWKKSYVSCQFENSVANEIFQWRKTRQNYYITCFHTSTSLIRENVSKVRICRDVLLIIPAGLMITDVYYRGTKISENAKNNSSEMSV